MHSIVAYEKREKEIGNDTDGDVKAEAFSCDFKSSTNIGHWNINRYLL